MNITINDFSKKELEICVSALETEKIEIMNEVWTINKLIDLIEEEIEKREE